MLFSSPIFIFLFLPLAVGVYYCANYLFNSRVAIAVLVLASLIYYGWWNEKYLILITGSVIGNYALGLLISNDSVRRKGLLILGIALNLGLLGYFKYLDFFINNINDVFGLEISNQNIILPLAISFFTFQQIAYLADSYSGLAREKNFLNYCLFVTFFPQLVAGPIVHHKEMLPQFSSQIRKTYIHENIAVGLSIFSVGLFKKVVLADNLAQIANPVFDTSLMGELSLIEAWFGALAYMMQLYFDFSGYSDMAIGLARLFGIKLPANFDSPYKSVNITEFWRRWHMTLSRFLRDYLYIPLGGNRKGNARRYINLFLTMLLGGLWHGAGWTFIVWGALHGFYLCVNHAWASMIKRTGFRVPFSDYIGIAITFFAVLIGWVFFRATSFESAFIILQKMFSFQELLVLDLDSKLFNLSDAVPVITIATLIALFAPNTQQIFARYDPVFHIYSSPEDPRHHLLEWRPSMMTAAVIATMISISIYSMLTVKYVEFIYWSF